MVKEQFSDKAAVVAAVEQVASGDWWIPRTSKNKGLAQVSNRKLLRLCHIFREVKDRFGSREKLVEAVALLQNRANDRSYLTRLSVYPVSRLYDLFRSLSKQKAKKEKKQQKLLSSRKGEST